MSEPTSFIDFQLLLIEMERDRDRWRKVAEALAADLGKVEYASAEYENQLINNRTGRLTNNEQ